MQQPDFRKADQAEVERLFVEGCIDLSGVRPEDSEQVKAAVLAHMCTYTKAAMRWALGVTHSFRPYTGEPTNGTSHLRYAVVITRNDATARDAWLDGVYHHPVHGWSMRPLPGDEVGPECAE